MGWHGFQQMPLHSLRLLFFILLLTADLTAQTADQGAADVPIKINTTLLNIPLVVINRDGKSIAGLVKDDFTVLRNALKSQYVIGIHVDTEEDSKDVKIKVDRDGAIVCAKGILRPKRLTPDDAKK